MPIPGFSKYKLNLITHEITNKWGKRVKTRHDSRGKLVVSITRDNGMRTVKRLSILIKWVVDETFSIEPIVIINPKEIKKVITVKFKQGNCYVYHLRREGMNIEEGYVGVTNNPRRRFNKHKETGQPLCELLKQHSDIELELLFEGNRKSCFKEEKRLRPTENMGWNKAIGGK